jgi:hypothetical protein
VCCWIAVAALPPFRAALLFLALVSLPPAEVVVWRLLLPHNPPVICVVTYIRRHSLESMFNLGPLYKILLGHFLL